MSFQVDQTRAFKKEFRKENKQEVTRKRCVKYKDF